MDLYQKGYEEGKRLGKAENINYMLKLGIPKEAIVESKVSEEEFESALLFQRLVDGETAADIQRSCAEQTHLDDALEIYAIYKEMEEAKRIKNMENLRKMHKLATELIQELYIEHRDSCKKWTYGKPLKAWFEKCGDFNIEYENGKIFHYFQDGDNKLHWE